VDVSGVAVIVPRPVRNRSGQEGTSLPCFIWSHESLETTHDCQISHSLYDYLGLLRAKLPELCGHLVLAASSYISRTPPLYMPKSGQGYLKVARTKQNKCD